MANAKSEALIGMSCTACRTGEPIVTDAEIAVFHPQVPDWRLSEVDGIRRLERVFRFDDFAGPWRSRIGSGKLPS